ncbi:ABC transporter substrate-binding protein [Betaproteobacteria bacterium]|nr:ABC transporter substrate-binding protein [Betaproteobacteria bacterium]
MSNKLLNLLAASAVAFFLVGNSVAAVRLNFSHTMAPNSLSDLGARKFKELVEERTKGDIRVNVVTNCGLSGGDLTKAIEMVGTGDIDMHASAPTNAAGFNPRFYIFWMPFLFNDKASLVKIADSPEAIGEVNSWFKPLGIHLLGLHNAGARQISNSEKVIRTPADLNAMNIRVPGAQLFIDAFRDSFHANPTAMDFSEVYTALQQKTIAGQENPVSVFDSSKFSEVQNHLTLWDYVLDSTGWYISLKTLNEKLNDAQRKIVTESAAEAIKWAENYLGDSEKKILEKLKGQGVEITVLNDNEKKAFKEATQPLYSKYESIIGKNVFDLFRRVGGN